MIVRNWVGEPDAVILQVRFEERGVEPEHGWILRHWRIERASPSYGQPNPPRHSSTLLLTLEELGMQLRRQAAQVGMEKVQQWVALSDAGQGFERFFDVYFPRAVKIVDFRHATEHLTGLAKGLGDDGSSEGLLTTWCHQLKREGGASVLATVMALDREAMDAPTRAAHDDALSYFGNHHERMKYPEYLAKGWQIGSGSVESACKNVLNHRLSMGGMRWGEEGGDAVAHLRALFRSEACQWDAFWLAA